jgi:hypothetical protein
MNLEQQRKRAKDLLRAYRLGEPDAIRRMRAMHPRAAGAIQLADAQLVVAREAGFPSWPKLVHAVEPPPAIEAAAKSGDVAALRVALASKPPT